jgi:hypothetical protein
MHPYGAHFPANWLSQLVQFTSDFEGKRRFITIQHMSESEQETPASSQVAFAASQPSLSTNASAETAFAPLHNQMQNSRENPKKVTSDP